MVTWARGEPSVKALVLFGSQVQRRNNQSWSADEQSDWDFQIITSRPRMFLDATWLRELTPASPKAYAVRVPRVGAMPKITAVLAETEADFVIIPASALRMAKYACTLGLHHRFGRLRRSLQDLAIVIRPGFQFLKGKEDWDPFYRKVLADVADRRLDNAEIENLAHGFVCDYVWALRKLKRGELVAVQRMLHRELAETNFRILHELKLRSGERTFPEARRLERLTAAAELASVSVNSQLQVNELRAALEHCATTLRGVVYTLIGDTWRWPDL